MCVRETRYIELIPRSTRNLHFFAFCERARAVFALQHQLFVWHGMGLHAGLRARYLAFWNGTA